VTGRPKISIAYVALAAALWALLFDNASFWITVFRIVDGRVAHGALVAASLFATFLLLFNAVLLLACYPGTTRPILVFLFLTASAAAYFMDQYGVMLDRGMIHNVFATDPSEVRDLLTPKLFLYLLVLGVLPSALLMWVRIEYHGFARGLLIRAIWVAATAAAVGATAYLFYQDYASLFRNHREIRFLLTPTNYLNAMYGLTRDRFARPKQLVVVGEDAVHAKTGTAGKPTLTVIVVGETARAANFSLGGYARRTNPLLARQDIFYYPNASSCGTDTASSVPCMFSNLGRDGYSADKVARRENLLDILKRAGIAVRWIDNNSGCKGVCDRVGGQDDVSNLNDPALCRSDECYDEVLLSALRKTLDGIHGDAVVVLHQKGSHGPAYYLRYPDRFGVFTPVCRTAQLEKCNRDEIVNAYDNSILYTDYVLDQAIDLLKHNAGRFDTALIYMSDHGESLGENNLFLHGLPRLLAPEQQTHIPFIVWLSTDTLKDRGLDHPCLAARRGEAVSHDNLFHSVLGLMDVRTRAYRPELDLFRSCRRGG
jgi:lipid A ethanolaminephosphotransferase